MAPLLFLYASRIILIVPVIASTIAALILQCGGGSKKKNSKNTKKVVVGQPLWKNAIPNDRVDPRKREYQTLFGLRNEQIFPAKRTKEPLKKKKGKKHIMQRRNDSPMKGDDPEKAEYSKSEKEKSGRAVPNTDRDRPDANDDYAALENLSVTKPGEQADWKDNKTGDSEKKKEGFGDLDAYGTLKDIQHDDIFLSNKR